MRALILRLDAPLMSFGTVAVDNWRPSGEFPALSAVTGLIGAALGYKRHETQRLQRLQERLRLAVRIDRRGELMIDYQTVNLGKPWMDGSSRGVGWTTRHQVETRKGQNVHGTHLRFRQYWADCIATLAFRLEPETESPGLTEIAEAINYPVHPLYLGRKGCPPASPLLLEEQDVPSLYAALENAARPKGMDKGPLLVQLPQEERGKEQEKIVRDQRDWANQIHAGSRLAVTAMIDPAQEADDE